MISAFGVDHGDVVSKAKRRQVAGGARPPSAQAVRNALESEEQLAKIPQRARVTDYTVGDLGRVAGNTLRGSGNLINRHPAFAGTTILGGTGYGIWRRGRGETLTGKPKVRRRDVQRKTVFRNKEQ